MDSEKLKHHMHCMQLVPIFNHLEDDVLEKIARQAQTKQFKKGEYIYQATDKTSVLFIVHTGTVRIFRMVASGKEQLVRILGTGDFTGEWSIFNTDSSQEDYAQAMTDTTVCLIYQDDFQDLLADYPEISMKLLTEMSNRLRES